MKKNREGKEGSEGIGKWSEYGRGKKEWKFFLERRREEERK